jgi:hypothetical protein
VPEPEWEVLGVSGDGGPMLLHGVDVWRREWHSTHQSARVPHPQYPNQTYDFPVYRLDLPTGSVLLATGEVSAGAFAMYWRPAT